MAGWNFADVWETVAETLPDAPAQVQGERRFTWAEFDRRADGVARALIDEGVGRQGKVAQYLYNCPEYLESVFACFKAGLVPVNTNYRYREDELVHLWDNADAAAVVFHGALVPLVEAVRLRVPRVRVWVHVDDATHPCPDWATPYEQAATAASGRTTAPWGRSGDDLLILYTGGTTGMPKGVMWKQHDVYGYYRRPSPLSLRLGLPSTDPPEQDLGAVRARLAGPGFRNLVACPLMHGTGLFASVNTLRGGGCIITLPSRRLDVTQLLDAVQREGAQALTIVGDPFARPILEVLEAKPERWDLSSLVYAISSGAMWSEQVKQGIIRHHPKLICADAFGSSEALGIGSSLTASDGVVETAKFGLGDFTRVVTDDGRDVAPGSGRIGMVAVGGGIPLGYYKDPERTARTFRVIDGQRYAVPGDYATVDADGTIRLLGRGNVCINTAGEKVFPEEVEEALKEHPAVADAVVVGLPDERYGEAVTAVVELAGEATEDELVAYVKRRLAGYKAPRRVVFVDSVGRGPSGKADYNRVRREAAQRYQ